MSEQLSEPDTSDVDNHIVDAVDQVRNRFGASGLRQLIAVASTELAETEQVVSELSDGG